MKIMIKTVPKGEMRYDTAGDWMFADTGDLEITVASTGSDYFDFLVAVHEAVEAMLCRKAGITGEAVTMWDLDHQDAEEPGELPGCLYRAQHLEAEDIEKQIAAAMGLDWGKYDEVIRAL